MRGFNDLTDLHEVGQRSIVVMGNNSYRVGQKTKTCHRKFVVVTLTRTIGK
jgi:hypothetical protein